MNIENHEDIEDAEREARMDALAEYEDEKARRRLEDEQEECPHDEHDHGICLDCGKDIWDDVVAAAEFRAECLEDR